MGFIPNLFRSFRKKSDVRELNPAAGIGLPADAGACEPGKSLSVKDADLSLVAVITATVAMMMSAGSETSAPYPGFRVKRIRRLM